MVQPTAGLLTSDCGGTFGGTRPSCVSCDSCIVNVRKNKPKSITFYRIHPISAAYMPPVETYSVWPLSEQSL